MLLLNEQVGHYFKDLRNDSFETYLALVHSPLFDKHSAC